MHVSFSVFVYLYVWALTRGGGKRKKRKPGEEKRPKAGEVGGGEQRGKAGKEERGRGKEKRRKNGKELQQMKMEEKSGKVSIPRSIGKARSVCR